MSGQECRLKNVSEVEWGCMELIEDEWRGDTLTGIEVIKYKQ